MAKRALGLVWVSALVMVGGCSAEPASPVPSALHGVLFINEFMAANSRACPDEFGEYADWIELYNSGDAAIHLRPMFITDDLSVPTKWAFPDTVVPAHGYVVVWADADYRQGPLHASFRLDAKDGEQLGLYMTDGDHLFMVDTLSFGPQRTDTSWGRIPDGGSEWRSLTIPTPGAENCSGISAASGHLFINEFMASNRTTIADEAGDFDDWVELYNQDTTALSLSGMYLTDDLETPLKWSFPDVSIPAGGHLLVWADNEGTEGPLHASFNLGAAVGEQLGLFALSGQHALLVDTLSFGHQGQDTSFGRMPDGGDTWQLFVSPTPGRANEPRKSGPLHE